MKKLIIGLIVVLLLLVVSVSCAKPSPLAPAPTPTPTPLPTPTPAPLAPVDIPKGPPVIAMDVDRVMAGEFSHLYIYEDGTIIYVEEKGLRMPTRENPPTRTWKKGQLQEEELNSLLEFFKDSRFGELDEYYKFQEPTEGGGFRMGDMGCTVYVNYGDLHKKVSALGYLTPDHGMTYPDMPYPLNEIYKKLKHIAENKTEEVARESI